MKANCVCGCSASDATFAQQFTAINLPSSFGTQFIVTGINQAALKSSNLQRRCENQRVQYGKGTFSTVSFLLAPDKQTGQRRRRE